MFDMAPPTAMIAAAPTIGGLTIILFSEHRFVFITTASFLFAIVWKVRIKLHAFIG
ncbi:hypothetical protein BVRB_6g146140 isoform D [Beta vulgaris subsp. vulgaris]|nr:hypothetical protein BVRB_6g146140 isoform D [Beta vulgaris subsp. vulgaris]